MVDTMKSIGWVVLDEVPGREIALGTGAQPWLADGEFRSIPAGEFRAFREPRYVKIALTLKAEPIGPAECYLSTETRASATDEFARKRFRVYWAFLSPGIRLIRWPMLARARRLAERGMRPGKAAA